MVIMEIVSCFMQSMLFYPEDAFIQSSIESNRVSVLVLCVPNMKSIRSKQFSSSLNPFCQVQTIFPLFKSIITIPYILSQEKICSSHCRGVFHSMMMQFSSKVVVTSGSASVGEVESACSRSILTLGSKSK